MLTGLEDVLRDYARDLNDRAVDELVARLHEVTPVDTGELLDSFVQPVTHENHWEFSTTLGYTAPQAGWTDEGVSDHTIFPTNARSLRFFWGDGPDGPGTYNFAAVSHPGYEGTGWFTDTVEQWPEILQREAWQ